MVRADRLDFFVGCGRSGTTLVRTMFDAHPRLAVVMESNFVPVLARVRRRYERPGGQGIDRFVGDLFAHPKPPMALGASKEEVRSWIGGHTGPAVTYSELVRRVFAGYAAREGKERVADKTPKYVLDIELLSRLFPEARFVHIIRDGRDVALSYPEWRSGPDTVVKTAYYWRRHVSAGRRAGDRLGPQRYAELSYEALMEAPDHELTRVCRFLGLEFDQQMLRYFERRGAGIRHAGHAERMATPLTKGLRDWRTAMPEQDLRQFEVVAGDLLDQLGYGRATTAGLRSHAEARLGWVGWQLGNAVGRYRKLRRTSQRAPG